MPDAPAAAAERLVRDLFEERRPGVSSMHLLNAGDGGLGTELRRFAPGAGVTLYERDARLARASTVREGLALSDGFWPEADAGADFVVLLKPKGRAYARTQVVAAHAALGEGGRLWIAGPSTGGVQGIISDAKAVFGNAAVLGYKHKQRVAECVKTAGAVDTAQRVMRKWWGKAGVMPGTHASWAVGEGEDALNFAASAGVFSWEHLDAGTAILLASLDVPVGGVVHDVGCGAGVLGVTAATRGAARVVMSDVDRLAVRWAAHNAEANGVADRCGVVAQDGLVAEPGTVDLVVSNPAFHRGEAVDLSMAGDLAERAAVALRPGGVLLVVANRFLAYHKLVGEAFGVPAERVHADEKFHVIRAIKPAV